ncbi:LysR family transcriptional regulator ArgP [Colwellia sp. MEBiC06753]
MNSLPDYKLLTALDAIMREQSFDKAADKLAITQSAISQRIKQLELLVGHPVIIRGTPLTLTSAGEKLLKHIREVELLRHQLKKELFPEQMQSAINVAIALNADSLASWFIPAISPLLQQYPIELDLHVANENATQTMLAKGEVFAAISTQKTPATGCKVAYLGELNYYLCASPEFIQQYFAEGLTPETLTTAPGVNFDAHDEMHTEYMQQVFNLAPGQYPCHRVRSSEAFVNLALAGAVYTLLPITQANSHFANGTLVNLAPDKPLVQHLYWHSWALEKGIHKRISERVVTFAQKLLNH